MLGSLVVSGRTACRPLSSRSDKRALIETCYEWDAPGHRRPYESSLACLHPAMMAEPIYTGARQGNSDRSCDRASRQTPRCFSGSTASACSDVQATRYCILIGPVEMVPKRVKDRGPWRDRTIISAVALVRLPYDTRRRFAGLYLRSGDRGRPMRWLGMFEVCRLIKAGPCLRSNSISNY